jgi:hypothetical protein
MIEEMSAFFVAFHPTLVAEVQTRYYSLFFRIGNCVIYPPIYMSGVGKGVVDFPREISPFDGADLKITYLDHIYFTRNGSNCDGFFII